MQEVVLADRRVDEAVASYASDWEHITDELRYLELLIRLRLLREQPKAQTNLLEQFRGLVLSDEEIAGLLTDPERLYADDALTNHEPQEQQELVKALCQLESHMQQRLAASTRDGVSLSLPILAQL